MANRARIGKARSGRIRSALLVFGALLLFVAGLLLLFAPAHAEGDQSRFCPAHFPWGANGWIMGAQSHQPCSLAGG